MARKISVSFKETTKDLELYNLIMSMEDKSYEIKQILRKYLCNNKKQEGNKGKFDVDILNF